MGYIATSSPNLGQNPVIYYVPREMAASLLQKIVLNVKRQSIALTQEAGDLVLSLTLSPNLSP